MSKDKTSRDFNTTKNINESENFRPHSGISHSFDTGLAAKYGLECSLLINHFAHWIDYNRRLKKNFKEGRTWTYQTRKELAAHFPYFNEEQVRYFTDKLVEEGVLIKGNFNKSGFDKTLWYAFKDEEMFAIQQKHEINLNQKMFTNGKIPNGDGKIPNGDGKIPKPIPNTKTDTKKKIHTNNSESSKVPMQDVAFECVLFLVSKIKEKDRLFGLTPIQEKQWHNQFIKMMQPKGDLPGRTAEEIIAMIEFARADDFWAFKINTPQNLIDNASKILTKMKSAPIEDKEEIEKKAKVLAAQHEAYAKALAKKYPFIQLSDGLCYIKYPNGSLHPIGFSERAFVDQIENIIKHYPKPPKQEDS